ncbi:MAG TPA: Crp/Fnr family transcriptional regulator [Bacteroidales bacterium]|nr:Crp/Fnr family transcriptional regulator [Bacteroidales bacterium]HPE56676.1 Crp/Fnr family transcriptional regulator [Bacteroidales bacterium]
MGNRIQITACTISSRHCRCFEKLTDEELDYMNKNSVVINYNKKEVICKQGSFVSHVMYVEKGLVKVYLDNGANSLVLKMIPEGNLLGLSSLSEDHNTYQYSAMAYIDTEIRQIDIRTFRELLTRNANFAKEVIDIFSANSVQVYGRFFCLTHKQAYGRLADILLCLSERIFKKSEFHLPLSRKDLAELSGMSSETVIRMLKKFNDDGLIEMNGKELKIVDYDRLLRISETG